MAGPHWCRRTGWLVVGLCAALCLRSTPVFAQSGSLERTGSDLEREQFRGWLALHGGGAALAFALAATVDALGGPSAGACGAEAVTCFGPDRSVEDYFSESAQALSNVVITTSIVVPWLAQFSDGFSREFAKSTVIQGQSLGATLVVNTVAKELFGRTRPYTHSRHPDVVRFCDGERQAGDTDVSFPSGHSATAFASAMAGSLLYAARVDDRAARHVMWATEFALAAATAELRVFAGRHYRTDILAGSLLGAAMGLVVPALHGAGTPRVQVSEALTAAGAAVATVGALELIHYVAPNAGPWRPDVVKPLPGAVTWQITPQVYDAGAALGVSGTW